MWSGHSANDKAFRARDLNAPHQEGRSAQTAELGDEFSIDFNGTVGEKCRRLMESFKHPLKVHDAAWLRKGCVNC